MSTHSPGALRAAVAIINSQNSIPTAEGEKSTGELADFIERETRVVELIDAAQRVLKEYDAEVDQSVGTDPRHDAVAGNMDQLREALRAVTDRASTEANQATAPTATRGH